MKEKEETKTMKSMVYKGLGFPIKMINVPMVKIHGNWALNISHKKLVNTVLEELLEKPTLLSGSELRFIRQYLELSSEEFGKQIGVSHSAVIKWENESRKQPMSADVFIRMLVLDQLNRSPKIFRDTFNIVRKSIVEGEEQAEPIRINAEMIG